LAIRTGRLPVTLTRSLYLAGTEQERRRALDEAEPAGGAAGRVLAAGKATIL
jgi:hypothetical protein